MLKLIINSKPIIRTEPTANTLKLVHSRPPNGYEILKLRVASGYRADARKKHFNKYIEEII